MIPTTPARPQDRKRRLAPQPSFIWPVQIVHEPIVSALCLAQPWRVDYGVICPTSRWAPGVAPRPLPFPSGVLTYRALCGCDVVVSEYCPDAATVERNVAIFQKRPCRCCADGPEWADYRAQRAAVCAKLFTLASEVRP